MTLPQKQQPPYLLVTTASDGAWELTTADVRLIAAHPDTAAMDVALHPEMSRPLPTSVVYRVRGMLEREEVEVP